MNGILHRADELEDYIDLRSQDLADQLGLCSEDLREMLRQEPTFGPLVSLRDLLDRLGLIELHLRTEEERHER